MHGSDADIGGTSTSNWVLGEDGRAKFWGVMRLKVRPEAEGRLRGGYAGIRARVCSLYFISFCSCSCFSQPGSIYLLSLSLIFNF